MTRIGLLLPGTACDASAHLPPPVCGVEGGFIVICGHRIKIDDPRHAEGSKASGQSCHWACEMVTC